MTEIKLLIINLVSAVVAFLSPIHNFMVAMVILFIFNFVCGLLAEIINGGEWSTKKALVFIEHSFIFFGLATFLFAIGHFMGNDAGAVQCVSYICYTTIYMFAVNILRNLRTAVSEDSTMGRVFSFLYYVLSLKVVEKVPYLAQWQKTMNEKRKKDNEND